jgi:protein-tyrosine phosphatase
LIDLHSHVLHGIDDGPRSLDGSLAILRAAHADGIERIAATPHVRHDHPTRPEQMEAGVDELNALDTGVEVMRGGELDVEFASGLDEATLRRFGLGGNPNLLLLEFPYVGWPDGLADRLHDYAERGFTVLLAHPERNPEVQADPERVRGLVEAGAYVQLTAASLDGRLGAVPERAGRALADAGLAHVIASDGHESSIREIGMRSAAASLGDVALAHWFTADVPRALVAGEQPPSRPDRRI